jgi:hypothetical protein
VPVQACTDTEQFPESCQALVCVNARLHSRQTVCYGVCLGVAQACSSPKVQRCLANVAEQTECQCKLATDILLSASAVGTPVQACADVAYALISTCVHNSTKNVRLVQFLLPRPLQACRDLRGSRKKLNQAKPAQKGQSKRTCLPFAPSPLLLLLQDRSVSWFCQCTLATGKIQLTKKIRGSRNQC